MYEVEISFNIVAEMPPKMFNHNWYNNLYLHLRKDIIDWCDENTPGWTARYNEIIVEETIPITWMEMFPVLIFKKAEDAILFKLKFTDYLQI